MNLLSSDSEQTVWKDSVVVDFLIISCLLISPDCTAVHPCPDPIHVLYSEARPSILVLLSYSTVLILTDLLSSLWTSKSLWLQTCSVCSVSADVLTTLHLFNSQLKLQKVNVPIALFSHRILNDPSIFYGQSSHRWLSQAYLYYSYNVKPNSNTVVIIYVYTVLC